MKKLLDKIASLILYWINWLCSREVLTAINSGATYDEVDAIARKHDAR